MSVVIGIAVGLALVVVGLRVFENRLIYFPPRYPDGFEPPERYGLQVEEVWLTAEDGVKLNGWYIAHSTSSKVLLMFHGNAVNLGQDLLRLQICSRLGVNLFEVDYRGYGKSDGSPHEAGVYRDADAAYRYLVEVKRHQPKEIFIHGQSLGGAVAIDLASRRECGGLIVESSFTSAGEMARRMFFIPWFAYIPKSRFDSLAKIARVRSPVLIVHGTRDEVIPFSMGKSLYEAAPKPKSFLPVEGAGHNDCFLVGGNQYLQHLGEFIGLTLVASTTGLH